MGRSPPLHGPDILAKVSGTATAGNGKEMHAIEPISA